jgi:hypothetical protein
MKMTEAMAINRLAELDPMDYERERKSVASRLNIRGPALDRLVRKRQMEKKKEAANLLAHRADLPPWPDPVDGTELLDRLTERFDDYLVLRPGEAWTCALWAVFTHAHDLFHISPRLKIQSPEPNCGKRTLLDVLYYLVSGPLLTAHTTRDSATVVFSSRLGSVMHLINIHQAQFSHLYLLTGLNKPIRDAAGRRRHANFRYQANGPVARVDLHFPARSPRSTKPRSPEMREMDLRLLSMSDWSTDSGCPEASQPRDRSVDSLRSELIPVRTAWSDYRANRDRAAIYRYLETVFALVAKWTRLGCAGPRARRAVRLHGLTPPRGQDAFAAVIACTAKTDRKARSRWSRALRYAAMCKTKAEPVCAFIQRNGGIDGCAALFSPARSR